jgi:hypothetical protein
MTLRIRAAAAAAALALCAVGPGLAQVPAQAPADPLPDGPGKDAVVRVCTQCHDASQFAYARYTPEGWDNEIAKMQSAGALMTADEQLAISAYLAKHLSPTPESPTPEPPAPAAPPR